MYFVWMTFILRNALLVLNLFLHNGLDSYNVLVYSLSEEIHAPMFADPIETIYSS